VERNGHLHHPPAFLSAAFDVVFDVMLAHWRIGAAHFTLAAA
jgi:hypothetical protein